MAALSTYESRIPPIYRQRYTPDYWIIWANALLDRLSGAGILPPQRLAEPVEVYAECWIDKPATCRDVISITDNARREEYRFVEENGKIRLLDARFPEVDTSDPNAEPPTLTMVFIAPYVPVESLADDMGFDITYENLADTWFRWKIEEQVSTISQECAYWGGRVESELARLRAEKFNRANPPRGRSLSGFMGSRRHA
jgi:hypothetical protein